MCCYRGAFVSLRTQQLLTVAFVAVGVLIFSVAAAEACTCFRADSPAACEVYKGFDVAFVGRAIQVPPDRGAGPVRFRLAQSLKGVAGPEVTVLNEESGLDCGYQFREGQDYVVFAERDAKGAIDIGRCTSTVWLVHPPDFAQAEDRWEAAEAVAFADSLRKPASAAASSVTFVIDCALLLPAPTTDRNTCMARPSFCRVRRRSAEPRASKAATSSRACRTARIASASRCRDGFPPARSARPPEHLVEQGGFGFDYPSPDYTRSVTIADARSCGYAPFAAVFDGEVAGSIVHARRHPCTRNDGRDLSIDHRSPPRDSFMVQLRTRIATAPIASSTCRRAATSSGSTFGTHPCLCGRLPIDNRATMGRRSSSSARGLMLTSEFYDCRRRARSVKSPGR